MKLIAYFLMMFTFLSFDGQPVIVCPPEGEAFVFYAYGPEHYSNVLEQLQNSYGSSGEVYLDFTAGKKKGKKSKNSQANIQAQVSNQVIAQASTNTTGIANNIPFRDYSIPVTPEEKNIIATIVNTLGTKNTAEIWKSESYLTKIGAEIEHIHPFRFLLTVFTDEQMKASIQAIERGIFGPLVWKKFFDNGLKKSLEYESNRNNLKQEYIDDFSAQIGIDSSIISPAIHNHQWKQLVSILISSVPRSSNANRYNM